ncbi:hypothetical protein [uncultured Chitinophaga sp.]|jgi:hypothetical protein|uniref:hypothetical protein n=1 Tax=uncultured Chitinophaga sp. TaxID=339340 RepID=UPI002614A18C|nr:hypothetical protein [uncultured Chitinophaga sp.]
MSKTPHVIFIKSLLSMIGVILLAGFLYLRADKEKTAFHKLSGELVYFERSYQNFPNRDKDKYRYLALNNSPSVFEIFVGKDAGDFKPAFEQIDQLKKGDEITIYFDEQPDHINRLAYFIDRGNEPIFIKGAWEKKAAYFLAGLSIAIIILLIVLKQLGKII